MVDIIVYGFFVWKYFHAINYELPFLWRKIINLNQICTEKVHLAWNVIKIGIVNAQWQRMSQPQNVKLAFESVGKVFYSHVLVDGCFPKSLT